MAFLDLTHETWLDLVVNMVPMAILLLLDAMFFLYNPWGWDLLIIFFWHFLTLFPFAVLALVTYVSGLAVQRDEAKLQDPDEMTGPREAPE